MLYALSLNPSLDKTASLSRFSPDAPNRVQPERTDVGGKGVNVARVVRELGGSCLLMGFDYRGQPVRTAMEREDVPCQLIAVDSELRVNLKLRETETGRTIEINEPGPEIPPEVFSQLRAALLEQVQPGDWVSLSGRLAPGMPADTYANLCAALGERGCLAAADCDGDALRAVIKTKPALIKPNAQEFAALTGVDPLDERAAAAACQQLISSGMERICLSMGERGAMLADAQGAWLCPAPNVPVRGLQGAGDSMLAALMTALERKMEAGDALRFASAAAGASVMRPGTLLCRRVDMETLLKTMPPARRVV